MKTPRRKLNYVVGKDYSIGTPTQQRTGLGKIVTVTGFTGDNRRVIVADKDDPTRTAEVKFSNIGYLVAPDGTYVDMITGKSWKPQPRRELVLRVPHDTVPVISEPLQTNRPSLHARADTGDFRSRT